jgi:hypothetical protein
MTVISFRDGRPLTDPWSLRCLLVELCVELEEARRKALRDRGLTPGPGPLLYLVPEPRQSPPSEEQPPIT